MDDFIVMLASYFSFGWTQQCVHSLFKHCNKCPLLIIDNNPSNFDTSERLQSYSQARNSISKRMHHNRYCDAEIHWIKQHNIHSVKTPARLWHGECINLAMQWCVKNKIKWLIHIEPDCVIHGNIWLDNLLKTRQDFWMAGGTKYNSAGINDNSLHITPTIWSVENTHHLNFHNVLKGNDIYEPEYSQVYNHQASLGQYHERWWDTGSKAWYECAKRGKAKHVSTPDLWHLWQKSSVQHIDRILFI
jgi:hypothetical protein